MDSNKVIESKLRTESQIDNLINFFHPVHDKDSLENLPNIKDTLSSPTSKSVKDKKDSFHNQYARKNIISFKEIIDAKKTKLSTPESISEEEHKEHSGNDIQESTKESSIQKDGEQSQSNDNDQSGETKDIILEKTVDTTQTLEKRKCEYRTCNYYYFSPDKYQIHKQGHCSSGSLFCDFCNLCFTSSKFLDDHMKYFCIIRIKDYIRNNTVHQFTGKSIINPNFIFCDARSQLGPALVMGINNELVENPIASSTRIINSVTDKIPVSTIGPTTMFRIQNNIFKPPLIKNNLFNEIRSQPTPPNRFISPVNNLTKSIPCEVGTMIYVCNNYPCSFTTNIKSNYKSHMVEFHNKRNTEICPSCGNGFATKKILSLHKLKYCQTFTSDVKALINEKQVNPKLLKNIFNEERIINTSERKECEYECLFKSFDKLDMKNHLSKFHSYGGRFICSHCQSKFVSIDLLAVHEELYCIKIPDLSSLEIEKLGFHFKCPHVNCKYQGANIMSLKQHLLDHCDVGRTDYECDKCNYSFWTEESLCEHKQSICTNLREKKKFNIVNNLIDVQYN